MKRCEMDIAPKRETPKMAILAALKRWKEQKGTPARDIVQQPNHQRATAESSA